MRKITMQKISYLVCLALIASLFEFRAVEAFALPVQDSPKQHVESESKDSGSDQSADEEDDGESADEKNLLAVPKMNLRAKRITLTPMPIGINRGRIRDCRQKWWTCFLRSQAVFLLRR